MGAVTVGTPAKARQRAGLFLARFCVSAWIGAASLFVVVGVIEVTRGGFDSATKDALVALRFPAFYVFGVTLVSLTLLGTWLAGNTPTFKFNRRALAITSLIVVLVLMAVDYFWIFQPLLQMVTPPGATKPVTFVGYHEASKWINLVELFFCLLAAIVVNWPEKETDRNST
jgi:hypothetical protein